MSTSAEPDFDLDLHFLPAWARKPADKNRYEGYTGEPERRERRGPSRPDFRRPGEAPRKGDGPGRERRDEGRRGPRRDQGERPSYKSQPKPDFAPLPELNVAFIPDDHGVDSMTRQIRMTGRAYPLFEIAKLVLEKPERHGVTISIQRDAQGQFRQPLFNCAIDQTAWLSEEEAVRHVLKKHFDLFYMAERTGIEPPKGTYTFVAQCGLSGVVLGPPNYHDYQKQLHKLHSERFSRMPFDAFKARVRIVRDEEVVKKWIEDRSFRTEYVCLNMPEPLKLASMEEVESHFRTHHLPNILQAVDSFNCKTSDLRDRILSQPLHRLVRRGLEDQRRFPLQVMTILSQQFASRGLQFFKVNRTVTHVSVSRPHYLDMTATPVSEGVRKIVEYINLHPKCNRKQLVESLAPSSLSKRPAVSLAPPAAATATDATAATGTAAPQSPELPAAQPAAVTPPPQPTAPEPSPEQTVIISDLHWLIHQGHVIEFASGLLETAKRPVPKPVKPPKPVVPEAESGKRPAPSESGMAPEARSIGVTAPASSPGPEEATTSAASTIAAAPVSSSGSLIEEDLESESNETEILESSGLESPGEDAAPPGDPDVEPKSPPPAP